MEFSATYLLSILQVAWINILLSGDNAVVIAMACRSLPPLQRKWGILLGSGLAIGLRIIFAFMVTWLLAIPYLQAIGGLLLLWIAVSLVRGGNDDHKVKAHTSLGMAVGTIAVADMAMSFDNVVAIAAVASGDTWLFIVGLALSIPLIVVGATLISTILEKFPLLVWAGAALLGWIAGEMIVKDDALHDLGLPTGEALHYAASVAGAVLVVAIGWLLARQNRQLA